MHVFSNMYFLTIIYILLNTCMLGTVLENIISTTENSEMYTEVTCDSNNTCVPNETDYVSTDISITSTILNNVTVLPSNETVKKNVLVTNLMSNKFLYKGSMMEFCTCNIQRQFCDINCCCDPDCTYENKLVFEYCVDDQKRYHDTKFCSYIDYIYKNNTPYEWKVNQNGLFCIVRSNLPPQYILHKKQVVKTISDANFQKQGKLQWADININKTVSFKYNVSEDFTFGKNIWLLRNNSVLTTFNLPIAIATSICFTNIEVKYLENLKTNCAQVQIDESNKSLWAEIYFKNVSFLTLPSQFNTSLKNMQHCLKNICAPVEINICYKNLHNCSIINGTVYNNRVACNYNFYANEYFCFNLTKRVKYDIYHNGTKGIKKVKIFIELENIVNTISVDDFVFNQEFEVNFFWMNYTLNYSSLLSGNPGYEIGKKILAANLYSFTNVTNITNTINLTQTVINYSIVRNPLDLADSFLIFPDNKEGICIFNNETYVPIDFGYNMLIKCKLHDELLIKSSNLSATDICKKIQRVIFKYWSVSDELNMNRSIGIFGNADENVLSDWSAIIFNEKPVQVINNIKGQLVKGQIFCENITTTLKVDVFHGRMDFEKIINQEKIIGITFNFENKQTFQFLLKDILIFNVDLRMEVMFYDITTKNLKKYVDPPSLEIRLPYDFFYPFIKINNCSSNLRSFYKVIIASLVYSLIIVKLIMHN